MALSFLLNDLTSSRHISRDNFGLWLEQQRNISFHGILDNIGGLGIKGPDVSVGAVVASPSKNNPDYFYQWIRDGALTINSLVYHLSDNPLMLNDSCHRLLKYIVEQYLANSYVLQRTSNPSGDFASLSGLGEPKFNMNGEPFNHQWGRPQRDGPALRILTITNYLSLLSRYKLELHHELLQSSEWVFDQIVKPDLMYVCNFWRASGYDLWEEVDSVHLFTSLNQLSALNEGMKAARLFSIDDAKLMETLQQEFSQLRKFITLKAGFTRDDVSHMIETPSLFPQKGSSGRSGLDAATIIGVLSSHTEDTSEIPFDVDDSRVLNTLAQMVDDMVYRYPINHQYLSLRKENIPIGVGLGRYPEDVYNGVGFGEGNPWFLTTASAAELVYRLVLKLESSHADLEITEDNIGFYGKFHEQGTVLYGSAEYSSVMRNLIAFGDSFLDVLKQHVDDQGRMSEQFSRFDGYMKGAHDLTWSYSAVWNSIRWRDRVIAVSLK
ncbi:glycoside hydrolase family 15 protein [Babjeviella inositovora NRRL Y-12698]|uniref:glucan 1,4-alpha-glucosidase n=1 Tax=Babjeviella inositovora NRRL Y-12698 TaxID=984486 RepID=A0A1E3QVH6_9ASCO|nr:glycoside hydrolase family 15 protein [Babjeviella inositovora NRRL Y-12698]ODQ81659.1 glycoside hydrolase family 15 protein [Babjeviella inositovora NRRL Y-12698]